MTDSVTSPRPRDAHEGAVRSFLGLVWALSRKNFQVRFKRATLGVLWVVIQPAFQAAFLSFVFLRVLKIDTVEDYPLFVLSGMLPWAFFNQALSAATSSIVDNGSLVKKVALPLLVFPLAAVGGIGLAFLASILVLCVVALVLGHLSFMLLLLPVAIALQVALAAGLGSLTSSLHVAYRDVKYLVDSSMLVGLYATPVLYTTDRLSPTLEDIIRFNPMTGVLSLYRAAVFDGDLDGAAIAISVVLTLAICIVGTLVFRRRSDEFADLV